jgi:Arc/MetJ family transcription regulator
MTGPSTDGELFALWEANCAATGRAFRRELGYPSRSVTDILRLVSKRLVDIDDELLQDATDVLGTETMKQTVNRALEEVVRASRRRRHADRLARRQGLDLHDPEVMAKAWH